MKATFRMTVLVSALGMLGGWTVAQETGAVSGQDAATTTHVEKATADNGALPGDSHVRIVRLSEVKGMLGLDRKTGNGFEQTMQNMPIVEGEKLETADGYAEVEFEDNSTLRLAPNSEVEFPLLALRSSGAKASTMNVVKGTVYVNTENTKDNEFLLTTGETKMTVAPSTHLRLEVNESRTVLSVFNGSVAAVRGAETTVVAKKQSFALDGNQVTVAKKITEQPYDAWDKESIDYHERYSKANSFAGGGNAFGLSDLNYYGSFINAGGYGSFWQPYFVGAGWSPYANGLWALYPGAGYSWVSPYPWGWLPYHSGSWSFVPGYGWGWQPGGTWNGLNNLTTGGVTTGGGIMGGGAGTPTTGIATKGTVHPPLRPAPPTASASGAKPSLVMTNQAPIVFSKESQPGNFVFQKDSAGLGVPRGSLGNLNKVSNEVGRRGSASMEVYAAPAGGGMESSGVHGANRGPMTLRQGSPGDGAQGWRGNEAASRQGSNGGTQGNAQGGQTGAASRGGGGVSQPSGGGAPGGQTGASRGGGGVSQPASPK